MAAGNEQSSDESCAGPIGADRRDLDRVPALCSQGQKPFFVAGDRSFVEFSDLAGLHDPAHRRNEQAEERKTEGQQGMHGPAATGSDTKPGAKEKPQRADPGREQAPDLCLRTRPEEPPSSWPGELNRCEEGEAQQRVDDAPGHRSDANTPFQNLLR